MNANRDAAMGDTDGNLKFRHRWDAPPLKPKRPPMGGTIGRAEYRISSSDQDIARIFARFKHLNEVPA